MIRIFFILIISNILFGLNKVDINNADFKELSELPLSETKIVYLKKYLNDYGEIKSIYDLQNVDLIDSNDIQLLKNHIVIKKKKYTSSSSKNNFSYKIDQWLASEGNSEGISELWLDRYYNEQNVNKMNYDDFSSLPNLSPMDVYAILQQKKRGEIKGTFQLKNSPGISYYGYKNLLDFVAFQDSENKGIEIDFRLNFMSRNVPSTSGLSEDEIPINFINTGRPENIQKLYLGFNNTVKIGRLRHNNFGDYQGVYNDKAFVSFENIYFNQNNNNLRIDKIIIGNFNASFGQGLIFESGDSFQPRRTGHGFSKRQSGINYDLTRSSQFVLSGYAFQLSSDKFRLSTFYSDGSPIDNNKRDAIINKPYDRYILNPDGSIEKQTVESFSTFISMTPRLPFGYLNGYNDLDQEYKIYSDMINSIEERTIGGNLRFYISNSFNIGFTIYESMYDKVLEPQIIKSIVGGADDVSADLDTSESDSSDLETYSGDPIFADGYMSNSADSEIRAMYANEGTSKYWSDAKSYRKVRGFEFSKVMGKMSLQGEYGQLDYDFRKDPKAYIINAYFRFDVFDLLILFRDYDLHYDNPYQRSFSEYRRYKSTIFEDDYWLDDPIFANLYSSNPQPQAEKGFYIQSRYQFHEDLIAGIQWDSWVRKADEAQYFRIVNKLEWRPLFNYRIYLRYKLQSRGSFNIGHPSPYFTKEARIRFKIRLSNFDNIELLYSWNYTTFSPRPRLTGNSDFMGGEMSQGDIGSPDAALGFSFEHNFNENFKMKAGVVYANGFLWYIEDNDFKLFDTHSGTAHSWVSFGIKPNSMLSVKLKVSHSSDQPYTTIISGQSETGYSVINPYIYDQKTNFKIQIDYAL